MSQRLRLGLYLAVFAASSVAQTTVEIDNAWVRVLRVKQTPHEKPPARQHPDSVAVYLTDFVNHKAGDVAWVPADKDAQENGL